MSMPSQRILILLVNYFNESETCSFIRTQILTQNRNTKDVVIADNGSHDPWKLTQIAQEYSWVHVYPAGSNLGYLAGAAFGLKKYLGDGFLFPDFIILSNSDVGFVHNHFLEDMVLNHQHSGYDMIGPDIYSDLLHHHQNPFMLKRISLEKLKLLTFLSSNTLLHYLFLSWYYGKSWLISTFHNQREKAGHCLEVYGIHGSFMIFKKSFFTKGGCLHFPMHLFGEEIFLAEMATDLHLSVGYDPGLEIIHYEHKTTGRYKSRESVKQMNRSYQFLLSQRKGV